MKAFIIFLISFILLSCSSTKKVYVCGDHICINKAEAKQYFDENLTLEIRVITRNEVKKFDLVQLNTKSEINEKKPFNKLKIKKLNEKEEKKQKSIIKERKKLAKLKIKKDKNLGTKKDDIVKKKKKRFKFLDKKEKTVAKKKFNVKQTVYKKDICQIIDKCDIDNISNYLIKAGKNKGYPDLTVID